LLRLGAVPGTRKGDAVNAEGLARGLDPATHILLRHQGGTGTVEKEIVVLEGSLQGLALHEMDLGKARREELADAVVKTTRPQSDLELRQVLLEQMQHSRG